MRLILTNPSIRTIRALKATLPPGIITLSRSLTITLLFFSLSALAQSNFYEGFIITNNGDRIDGYIDYRDWDKSPDRIEFRKQGSDKSTYYSPVEVKEFSVSGEIYRSAVVEIETSPRSSQKLGKNPEYFFTVRTVFLQTIIAGEKSLFKYKDVQGHENFYIGADSGFDILKFKRYMKVVGGKQIIVGMNDYIGQLISYLSDCQEMHFEHDNLKYNEPSLRKFFDKYHECKGSIPSYRKPKEKTRIDFGLLSGLTFSNISFLNDSYYGFSNIDFKTSDKFSGGGVLDLIFLRTRNQWAISNEILYTSYKFFHTFKDIASEESYKVTEYTFNYSYIKLHSMVRYGRRFGGLFLSAKAGISNGFAVKENNLIYEHRKAPTFEYETSEPLLEENQRKSHELGYLVSVEARLKSISFDVRLEIGNGLSAVRSFRSTTRRIYILIGYRF